MKSSLTFCLLTFVLFSFFSCTKELSTENGEKNGGSGDFYATVNGNLWNADSLQLVLVGRDGVSINGLSKTGEQISMILPEFKIGTYSLSSTSLSYALFAELLDDVSNVFVSNVGESGGTVNITAIDTVSHLVSGNFQFNLTDPADNTVKTITEGIFAYIPYSGDGGVVIPPPAGGSDTLKAKVDGVPFDAAQIQTTVANSPSGGPAQLLIAGIAANGTQDLALLMPANVTAGTYSLDFTTGQFIGIYYPNGSATTLVSDGNGTLTIISNDTVNKRIKGTFSFNATPFTSGTPADITEGYFSVNY